MRPSRGLLITACGALLALGGIRAAATQPAPATLSQQLELCVACHGLDGRSLAPEWPSLAAQSESFAVGQLRLFRDGRRYDDTMSPMAKDLDDATIAALAGHFARLPMPGPSAPVIAATRGGLVDAQTGERLYRSGDPARGIAPCSTCHGEDGRGRAADAQPALRAQGAVYLKNQLDRYATGTRYVGKDGRRHDVEAGVTMQEIAAKLTESERASLAAFLQAMP